jgi:hypothetical protein
MPILMRIAMSCFLVFLVAGPLAGLSAMADWTKAFGAFFCVSVGAIALLIICTGIFIWTN